MQKSVRINDVQVPIIVEGGEKWYPINYVFEKVIGIKTGKKQLDRLEDISLFIKIYTIDMNFISAGKQNTYCISEEGLKIYLTKHIKIGRYSVEQRKLLNGMLEHLGLDFVSEQEQFLNEFNYKGNYNVFVEDCIEFVLKENTKIKWQKCSRCDNYFPYHKNFFRPNTRGDKNLNVMCRDCQKWSDTRVKINIKHGDEWLNRIYYNYGEDTFLMYKNHDVIGIYKHYLQEKFSFIPSMINNKNDIMIIIKWLYNNKMISKEQLNVESLRKDFKIHSHTIRLTQRDLYTYLFGDKWIECPWNFPDIKLPYLSDEEYIRIFNNYIKENNIVIDDIYYFNYVVVFKNAGIYSHIDNDLLGFVMKLYNNKYGAYKFKISGVNYWKDKDNWDRALKYYIEEDIKIDIDKIPLYLTKFSLQRNARTLYGLLYKKSFYKNLYEWVNSIYPNKYIEADFVINPYRDEFDSIEEMEINNVLKENFQCIVYNQRNTDRTIKIDGMIPDWIIFTKARCILIEYFGLWIDRENLPKRNKEYMEKVINKISKYKTLFGYNFIDFYPRDLKNNFEGVKNKIHIYLESK